jgi:dTDP-4-amino-4,6-dideoxygalactose transaminase
LTQGDKIYEFESTVAKFVGSKYAVAVSSGTAGLHLATKALNLPTNSQIVTSPLSFVASANSIVYSGHKPVFVDINSQSLNIDIEKYQDTVGLNEIKALVAVHYAGNTADFIEISNISKSKNIYVIEDAAHALGAEYASGEKVGSCKYSVMTVFSFHPVKSITTGEGGVITTNSDTFYRKLLRLRSHGINKQNDQLENVFESKSNLVQNPWYYEMQELGYHYRLTEIQAALGVSQMRKIDRFMTMRGQIANFYHESFKDEELLSSAITKVEGVSANHLYPLAINFDKLTVGRAAISNNLKSAGIGTQVHYIPIPMHPYYRKLGFNFLNYPSSLKYYYSCLSIPIFPGLTANKARKVSRIIKSTIKQYQK